MSANARLPGTFVTKMLRGAQMDPEAKAEAKRQLRGATYAQLEKFRKAADYILKNPDADWSKNHPLKTHLKFNQENLENLKKLLERKLTDVHGRQYHEDVLSVANEYDLESEDADAVYNFKMRLPARRRELSDQERFSKFMAKAKPDTKERMKNMSLEDFIKMEKAIFKSGNEGQGTAQAA